MTRRALAVLLGLLAVLLVPTAALAADHTVTLATSGPSPSALTIVVGDTVTFRASDANTYHVRRTAGAWTFSATVTRARPVTTSAFGAPGTYRYTMTFDTFIGQSPGQDGSIVVPETAPSPTPRASRSPRPTAKPSVSAPASPRPTATASPSGVPTPSAVAVPPLSGGVVPTPALAPTPGPAPQLATPGTPPSAGPSPARRVAYADPSTLVQGSPRGRGLPTALAVVAAVGVLSLLVRTLLAAPEARPDGSVR